MSLKINLGAGRSVTIRSSPNPTSTYVPDPQTESPSDFYILFAALGALAAILTLLFIVYLRRRQNRALAEALGRTGGRGHDLERWPRPAATPAGYYARRAALRDPARRHLRTRMLGFGSAGLRSHEDGLDEFGEAPPPYDPRGKPPSLHDGPTSIELARLPSSSTGAGPSSTRQSLQEGANIIEPPGYPEQDIHTANVATPPRAILPAGSDEREE